MVTFVLLAAALTAAAIGAVTIPLVKRTSAGAAPSPWAALAVAGFVAIGASVLYVTWSNWPWGAATAAADTPENMVARLARKLERNPDDLDGWLMLGRSYLVLQEYPHALRAFQRAVNLSGGQNADALIGEAEALAVADESEIDGRAGQLIERALVVAPTSPKALFFGAVTAERRGDLPLARERFVKLLASNLPQNLRAPVEQQISAIDERLAAGTEKPSAPAAKPAQGAGGAAASPVVSVRVTLSPALSAAAGSAALFVFVRAGAQPGPPLAVKRLDSHFPQTVTLTPSDSMIPGRSFAAGQSVQVVARIARSGSPVGASGDPFGEVTYHVGTDGLASLVIDRVTP